MEEVKEMKVEILLNEGIDKNQAAKIRNCISMIKGVYAIAYFPNKKDCDCKKAK